MTGEKLGVTFQKRSTPTRRLLALLLSWAVLPVPGGAVSSAPPAAPSAKAEPSAPTHPGWPEPLPVSSPRSPASEAGSPGGAALSPSGASTEGLRAPTLVLTSPRADAWVRTATVQVTGTIVPADAGTSIECRVGTARKGVPAQVRQNEFACSPRLVEGENSVRVIARDRARREDVVDLRVRLDTRSPVVKRLSLAEGQLVSRAPLTLEGEIEDESPVTVRVGKVETLAAGTTFSLVGVPVVGGPDVVLPVELEDAAGNKVEKELRLRVDDQAPRLAVASPKDGDLLRGTEVEARGSVTDEAPVTVLVNGEPAALACAAGGVGHQPDTRVGEDLPDPAAAPPGAEGSDSGRAPARYYGGSCTWAARVPVFGREARVEVVARDGAGNESRSQVSVVSDSEPPAIRLASAWPAYTAAAQLDLAGHVADKGVVDVTLDGRPLAVEDGAFETAVSLAREGAQDFRLVAADEAGNTSVRTLSVTVDRQAPRVEIAVPLQDAVLTDVPVVVRGTVRDTTPVTVLVNGVEADVLNGAAFEARVEELSDGQATLEVIARDAAGNESRTARPVRLDGRAPELRITSPGDGSLTREARVRVAGVVRDRGAPTLRVAGRDVPLAWAGGEGRFEADAELREGDNALVVEAEDAAGRVATARVLVTRDSTPPVVSLSGPARLLRSQSGRISAWVDDASPVRSVVFRVGGRPVLTSTRPPYALDIAAEQAPGESVAVEAEAVDAAGNVGRASHALSVVGSGVVIGQVLDDSTGLPLQGATVRVFAGGSLAATLSSDERGRYSAEVASDSASLRVEKADYVSVLRETAILGGLGSVAVDARLTRRAAGESIGSPGGTLGAPLRIHAPTQPAASGTAGALQVSVGAPDAATPQGERARATGPTGEQLLRQRQAQVRSTSSGDVSVLVPAGALPAAVNVRLTSLSAQGLPGLLPLGWSPLLAFDLALDGGAAFDAPVSLSATSLATSGTAHLVKYEDGLRAWVMAEAGVSVVGGAAAASLPSAGAYALVMADEIEPALVVPMVGEALSSAGALVVPPGSTAAGVVEPAIVPPSGGTAVGSVTLATTPALPSGTVVSAEVRESYRLTSGQTAVEESRLQDLLLYRQPLPAGIGGVGATFPMTPSRTFELTELESGAVRVSVKAGREGVRGTAGGSDPTQVENGPVRLQVPAGALPSNTAVSVAPATVPDYAAQGPGVTALHAVTVDLSGQTLALDAQLSFASAAAQPGDFLVVARLTRVAGIPRTEVVALGTLADGRIVSLSHPDLPGVRRGGEYVFYRLASQPGIAAGYTRASGAPVSAVVTSTMLPFAGVSSADGRYAVVAGAGANTLTASVPGTSLLGTAAVEVVAGATVPQDVALDGTLHVAVVRPVDGAQAVPTSVQVEIETTAALNPGTVTPQNVHLLKLTDTGTEPVAVRLVLSASRKLLAVVPEAVLLPEVSYRLEASGLGDSFGAAVSVPLTTFRTMAEQAPAYDYSRLVVSIPDADGLVTVSAPAGTFPPGTQVLIINTGNGWVDSFTADNQGAIGGQLPATLLDKLLISISDPFGHQIDLERSQYFDAATGLTSVNAGGGTISDPEGRVAVKIPEGAADQPVRLKVEVAPLETVPADTPPSFGESLHVGGVLKLESPDMPSFRKPLELAFEKPADAPEGAYYQVLRMVRLGTDPDAPVAYEAITDGQVVEEPVPGQPPPGNAPEAATQPGRGRTLTNYKVKSFDGELFGAIANFGSIVGGPGPMLPSATAYAVMMWDFFQHQPGTPLPAVVVATVVRVKPGNLPGQVTYEPVVGARVTAQDMAGTTLVPGSLLGQTQDDGTTLLWHYRYNGNPVLVTVTDPQTGEVKTGQATLLSPADTHGILAGRYRELSATVVLSPTEPPPPPPTVAVRLYTLEGGQRTELQTGVVTAGTPLLIGLTPRRIPGSPVIYRIPAEDGVEIQTEPFDVVPDALGQNAHLVQASGPGGTYVPGDPGTYVIRTRVERSDAPGEFSSVNHSFRVVAEGGEVEPDPLNPPAVLSVRTRPIDGADDVPVTVLPELAFSEPVKMAASNIELLDGDDPVAIKLIGVDGQGVISDVGDATVVTGVTIEPLQSLSYSKSYTLRVKTGLLDLDDPPKGLAQEYLSGFATFAPESLPAAGVQISIAGFDAMSDKAYVAHTRYRGGTSGLYQDGFLRTYDVSDPSQPVFDEAEDAFIDRPPADLTLERVNKQAVVVTGPKLAYRYHPDGYFQILSTPADMQVFDVSGAGRPPLVGLMSLTSGIDDGLPRRAVAVGGKAYVVTSRKGIQVADLTIATDMPPPGTPEALQMPRRRALGGGGFRLVHVRNIPVRELPTPPNPPNPFGPIVTLNDLEVVDLDVDGNLKRVVLATGQKRTAGLVVADTELMSVIRQQELPPMTYGDAIAHGVINDRHLAVVGGFGPGQQGLLQVVDLNPLAAGGPPQLVATMSLSARPSDLLLYGTTLVVATHSGDGLGTAYLVSLSNPEAPIIVGQAYGVGSRLAMTDLNLVLSTVTSYVAQPAGAAPGLLATAMDPQVCPSGAILRLLTPEVEVKQIVDPTNEVACTETSDVKFRICAQSRVSVQLEGAPLQASVDGGPIQALTDITLEPGDHRVRLPDNFRIEVGKPRFFSVKAKVASNPGLERELEGVILADRQNRVVRSVGHTLVQGVDVAVGHLTVGPIVDFELPGRHLPLSMSRTYSSAGEVGSSEMGAGWSWGYALELHKGDLQECNLVSLSGRDGSQVFRPTDGGGYAPQKGYHGRLIANGDSSFDYYDKANNKHHFTNPDAVAGTGPGDYRLDSVVEPHGDELRFVYATDDPRRLVRVVEQLAGRMDARHLRIERIRKQGVDRIASVEAFTTAGEGGTGTSLGLRADYQYDYWGNLIGATRSVTNLAPGPDAPEPRTWQYRYSSDPRDRHQMLSATNPNGSVTDYEYYADTDSLPGEVGGVRFSDKRERVKSVTQHDPRPLPTVFTYHYPDMTTLTRVTEVQGPRPNPPTRYTLDLAGLQLRREEPLQKATITTWLPNDVLMETETDAENRLTRFEYDALGNRTLERIEAADPGVVESRYAYHPKFSKPTNKWDAENRQTSWGVDDVTGDVRWMRDPAGNRTDYQYDYGVLSSETSPRQKTVSYSDHDSFGQWRRRTDALGNWTQREYDARGRLVHEWDSFGRDLKQEWDAFDRLTRTTRKAGYGSADEVVTRDYYPNGEPRLEVNANGAQTDFEIDGLGRVTSAATTFDRGRVELAKTYDLNGNLETDRDLAGVTRLHSYDELDRLVLTSITGGPSARPTGSVSFFEYNKVGAKTAETDLLRNARTEYTLDGLYRVRAKSLPDMLMPTGYTPVGPLTERYEYDKVGNRTALTDFNGHRTTFDYDALDRLVKTIKDPGGLDLTSTVRYCNEPEDPPTASGILKCEEHDLTRGLRVLYRYDDLNREVERKQRLEGPDGSGQGPVEYTTGTSYEDASHQVSVSDELRTVVTRLDGLDRVRQTVVDPQGLALTTTTEYDGLGKPRRVTDARGNVTQFWQDGLGRTWRTVDADLKESQVVYTGDGLKAREMDRRGIWRAYEYDNLRRMTREALEGAPLSGVPWSRRIDYRDSDRQRVELDAMGTATVFDLDRLGRVVREADAYGKTVETSWDGVTKRAVKDKRGNTTSFEYDAADRLSKATDPAPFQAQAVVSIHDDANNRVTEVDRRQTPKVTQFDPLGRVRTVTRAGVLLERNTYDALGNKIEAEDGEGRKTQFTYDKGNRLSQRIDGFGSPEAATTEYRYDENGNQTKVIDPRSTEAEPAHEYQYDNLNRVAFEWDGERNRTGYGYDGEGNRVRHTEPAGRDTTFSYDELGKLTAVTQPATAGGAPVTRYSYDRNRNKVEQIDAMNHKVVLGYDKLNRLTDFIQEGGLLTKRGYDPNGNVTTLTDPNGQTTTNVYDELNRVASTTYDLASNPAEIPWRRTASLTYAYDENGNATSIQETVRNQDGSSEMVATVRGYDLQDRLTSETVSTSAGPATVVGYDYYRNGARKTVTDRDGSVTLYEYDGKNRLKAVKAQAGTPQEWATTYGYWPDDLLQTVSYANGVVATHGYDRADRLTSLANAQGTTVFNSYGYGYDANGNRLTQAEVNGGLSETTSYGYDELNRLSSGTYPVDADHPNGRKVTYGYDLVGNRTSEIEADNIDVVSSSKVASFDSLNRLMSLTDSVQPANNASFSYDTNGNLLSKTTGGVTSTYVYDSRDKLVETRAGAQATARFEYDFEGRRTRKIGDGGVVRFVYDETSVLQELNEAGVTAAKYEWGSDRLISLARTNEPRRFYSFDGLGSVVGLTDSAGASVAAYHLDAWGNYRFPAELTASQNRFGFTGHYFDTETNLYYAKARYFDPELGRFLSQDSYLGELTEPPSLHRYLYAADRPTYYVDPTGHFNAVGDYANTGWGQVANTAANWGWEFYKGAWNTGANIYTLGAFGEAKAAYERGDNAAAGAAAGLLNTVTLGGAKGAVNSYVEGKNEAAGYIEGVADTFLPISEGRVLADPNASGWEKAQAVATGATKLATLGLAAKGAMPGSKAAATPVAEARTAAVAEPLPAPRGPAGLLPAAEPAGGARFIVDASGNVQDALAARGRMNPIGSQGPIELGPVTITDPRRLLPPGSLDDAIAANYQRYYTEAGRDVVRGFNRGNIKVPVGTNWEQILGGRIDSIARARLRNFLAREGIAEGPAADVAVNRWLRDPSGSGAYRIPDVLLRNSRRILDGTIGSKTQATPQVQDFGAFSGGYDVEIVRPDIAPFRR